MKRVYLIICILVIGIQTGFTQQTIQTNKHKLSRGHDNLLVGFDIGRNVLERPSEISYNKIGFSINPRLRFVGIMVEYDFNQLNSPNINSINDQNNSPEIRKRFDQFSIGPQLILCDQYRKIVLIFEYKSTTRNSKTDKKGSMFSIRLEAKIRPHIYLEGCFNGSTYGLHSSLVDGYSDQKITGWHFGLKYGFCLKRRNL